jgi:hypothetical protein
MMESQDALIRLEKGGVLTPNQVSLLSHARNQWLRERKPAQMLLEDTSNYESKIYKKNILRG